MTAPAEPQRSRALPAERLRAFHQALARIVARRVLAELDSKNAKRAGPGEDGASREQQENVSERHRTA